MDPAVAAVVTVPGPMKAAEMTDQTKTPVIVFLLIIYDIKAC